MSQVKLALLNPQGPGTVDITTKDAVQPPTFFPWTITANAGATADPSGAQSFQQGVEADIVITIDNNKVLDQVVVTQNGAPLVEGTDYTLTPL